MAAWSVGTCAHLKNLLIVVLKNMQRPLQIAQVVQRHLSMHAKQPQSIILPAIS